MFNIDESRKEIDRVDKEIVKLFEKRMDIVKKVVLYKKEKGIPIFNEEREKEVINKNKDRLYNKEYESYMEEFFSKLMEVSKEYQKYFLENKTLYGLLGEKLSHSVSPNIHSLIFEKMNISGDYEIIETEREKLGKTLQGLKKLNVKGVNVTIPYKVSIMNYIDEISSEAEKIGAVNTIKFHQGKMKGYNTDYFGFGKMLIKNFIEVKGKKTVILGSGGAALMVYNYFLDYGAEEITIITRNLDKVKREKKFNNCRIISYDNIRTMGSKDIIVNCTPCGMYPDVLKSPIDKEVIKKFNIAIDLIYNPTETLFLKYAGELGLKCVNGMYMLVAQAVKAEEIWNDISVSDEVIEETFREMRDESGKRIKN